MDKITMDNLVIEGNLDFIERTEKALNLVKKSLTSYEIVMNYIGILQHSTITGMNVYNKPPILLVSLTTYQASPTWYASSIVHESFHSKLYNDYFNKHGNVPSEIWASEDADSKCLEAQINFLSEIQAPNSEIMYAKRLANIDYWGNLRSSKHNK